MRKKSEPWYCHSFVMRMALQEDVRSGPRADGWNQFYRPRSSHLDNWKCKQTLPRFLQASIPCIPCIWCEWQRLLDMLLTTYSWFIQLFMCTFAYAWFWSFKTLPGCIESTQNERVIWGGRMQEKSEMQSSSRSPWILEPGATQSFVLIQSQDQKVQIVLWHFRCSP